jgi:hypothetical protein
LRSLPGLQLVDLSGNSITRGGSGSSSGDAATLPAGLVVDRDAPQRAMDDAAGGGVLSSSPQTQLLADPASYGYDGCSCKAPAVAQSEVQGGITTQLRCVLRQPGGPPLALVLGPLLAVTLASLLALACMAAAWRRRGKLSSTGAWRCGALLLCAVCHRPT